MKFEVGDRVEIIGNNTNGLRHYDRIGSIAKVEVINRSGTSVRIDTGQSIHVEDLRLTEDYILDKKLSLLED